MTAGASPLMGLGHIGTYSKVHPLMAAAIFAQTNNSDKGIDLMFRKS